jgi:MoaA/NifB/PqqE/SkfB family radical SAM enzyme
MTYYKKNEIPAPRVIKLLNKFKIYNPNTFHIFYGGEPFLRKDLRDILSHCNTNDIKYTVISNCTLDIQPKILKVHKDIGGLRGLTASIDPSLLMEPTNSHTQLKSATGFYFLMKMQNHIKDRVAEVTMTNDNIDQTYDLLRLLTSAGIYASLTAIDINKNYMYDFSGYASTVSLIKDSKKLRVLYERIMLDETLLIHMKDEILPELFRHISSDYDCEMEKSVHNLTIDADGCIRTCLRIRGDNMCDHLNDANILIENDVGDCMLNPSINMHMKYDRRDYCAGCNHTCVMMSKCEENVSKILNH